MIPPIMNPKQIDEQFLTNYLIPLFRENKIEIDYANSRVRETGRIKFHCKDEYNSMIEIRFELFKKIKEKALGSFAERNGFKRQEKQPQQRNNRFQPNRQQRLGRTFTHRNKQ